MAKDKKDKESTYSTKITGFFLKAFIFAIGLAIAAYIISSFISFGKFVFSVDVFSNSLFYFSFVMMFGLTLVFMLINLSDKSKDGKASVKAKGKLSKFYDTDWLSRSALLKDPKYMFHTYDQLSKSTKIGVPIRAEVVGRQLEINMYKSIHTLVIGSTGSGKTTQFVNPTIQILGESKAAPCMVITDPKGELYDLHSEKLRLKGYNIMVFDLKEPFQSTCWNPMDRAYEMNYRANHLSSEIKVHKGEDPRDLGLKCVNKIYYNEWYEFDGCAFADEQSLRLQMIGLKQKLKNDAFEDLKDIATALCPIQSNNDPIWERGAKDLVLGTMLAMLEDSENPDLGMTRERYNFYNLSKILNLKDNDAYNPIRSITEYFQGRDKLSLATQLANQVVTNAEKTAKSYMGIVTDRMGLFSDSGICYATSHNEMNLTNFADQPTALFIKIPDEKTTRHPIATLFISQLYKVLVDVANKRGGELPRNVYFILDEFANMPKIENLETIITVARSRRIFFTLILQSYSQLTIKYGQDVSSTIKDNCNIHVFIASNDQTTLEEFSKRCGNTSVETESISSNQGKKDEQATTSTSISLDQRPLIYPAELATLGSGECIISILKEPPIRSTFTPSYKATQFYYMKKPNDTYKMPKPLDEESLYYDIRLRNQKILRGGQNGQPGLKI